MIDLGTLGGRGGTLPKDVDKSVVVGKSELKTGAVHAFIYRGGQMIDLNDLIDASDGITLLDASSIGDDGAIVAFAIGGAAGQAGALVLLSPTATSAN